MESSQPETASKPRRVTSLKPRKPCRYISCGKRRLADVKTVLLIEDELSVQKIARATIEGAGFKCVTASDGREGLRCLASGPAPDLLLLDLVMPGMNGLEVLETLSATPTDQRFPVAVFSGKNQQKIILEALKLGIDDYIIKPFTPKDLVRRVKDLIFTLSEAELRTVLANLRVKDEDLSPTIAKVSDGWGSHHFYAAAEGDGVLCIATPCGKTPIAISKLPFPQIVASVGVFRRGAGGWRKIWPRFRVGS